MKKTITFYDFCDSFREDRKDAFSYNGKKALFEYLEQYEKDTGEEIAIDIVALCCEYTEYATGIDCAKNYFGFALSDIDNISAEEAEEEALKYLKNKTQIIEFEGGIIRKRKITTATVIKKQETELLRKTKNYTLEINNREVVVRKTWIDDMTYDKKDIDYEIEIDGELTIEEFDDLIDFMVGLE